MNIKPVESENVKSKKTKGHVQKDVKGYGDYRFVAYDLTPQDKLDADEWLSVYDVNTLLENALLECGTIGRFTVSYIEDKKCYSASYTGTRRDTQYSGYILSCFGRSVHAATACLLYVHTVKLKRVWSDNREYSLDLFDF